MLNEGFTADLYRINKPPVEEKRYDKAAIATLIVLSLAFGSAAYIITSSQPTEVVPAPSVLTLNATKTVNIANQWGMKIPFSNMSDYDGGTWCADYNSRTIFLSAQAMAFDYLNLTPPTAFVDARLNLPLTWFTSWAQTGPKGKDVGHWEDRNFTISIYEIKKPWPKYSTSPTTKAEYLSWTTFGDASFADRNAVDTISGIKRDNIGYGSDTNGTISFNIIRAINDWKNGSWNMSNGFLIAMIAPWETYDVAWFNYTGLIYLGIGLRWDMSKVALQIGLTDIIPEFGDILIPVFGMVMIAILALRRKPYIIPKT